MRKLSWFNLTSLTFGFAFLYLPMIVLVVYSFNSNKLVTVWAGFSTKWYGELFRNEAMIDAAWVTLRVAVASSTLATVLGTMAAYVLVRGGRFFGRTLFSGMLYAPLVMPDVILGLSLLLLFIAIGLDRGLSPSSSPTPPSRWPMWRSWSPRGSWPSTGRSKRPRSISAAPGSRPSGS
jgi:putrescine transport system permease protein